MSLQSFLLSVRQGVSLVLLSDKYWDYIDTPARAEFLEGSTASGKTTTVAVKFIMNVAESDMKLHVIAGNTTGVIEKNIINADMGLLQIFPNLEYCGTVIKRINFHILNSKLAAVPR